MKEGARPLEKAPGTRTAEKDPQAGIITYVPALDGIRAIAIGMVLAFHSTAPWAGGGYLGVDVFFVLSGFLITKLLSKELEQRSRIRLVHFYWRRALRLYPSFIVLLVTIVVLAPFVWPHLPAWRHALISGLYLTDYDQALAYDPTPLTYTWSLAVEEHFYLLWPLGLPFVLRLREPIKAMLLIYLLAFMWRVANLASLGWYPTYFRFDTRASGILLGCMLALMRTTAPPKYMGFAALALLACIAALPTWGQEIGLALAVPVAEACAAILVLSAFHSGVESRLLSWGPMPYVGRLSYGIYLRHAPVMFWLRENRYAWPVILTAGTAIAVALAALTYHLIDRPLRARRSAPAAATAKTRTVA